MKERKRENESGVIMLEALIVYMVTIFLLFFILALFSVFYHLWNMQTIANETAALVAQTYKLEDSPVDTGSVSLKQLCDMDEYRYVLGNSKALERDAVSRIKDYAEGRLDHTSFVKKVVEPKISAEVKSHALASRHIEMTLSESFQVPFGDILDYFGYDSTITYEAKAYANCIDVIDYIGTVDYAKQQTALSQFGSAVKMINAILKLCNHIAEYIHG